MLWYFPKEYSFTSITTIFHWHHYYFWEIRLWEMYHHMCNGKKCQVDWHKIERFAIVWWHMGCQRNHGSFSFLVWARAKGWGSGCNTKSGVAKKRWWEVYKYSLDILEKVAWAWKPSLCCHRNMDSRITLINHHFQELREHWFHISVTGVIEITTLWTFLGYLVM